MGERQEEGKEENVWIKKGTDSFILTGAKLSFHFDKRSFNKTRFCQSIFEPHFLMEDLTRTLQENWKKKQLSSKQILCWSVWEGRSCWAQPQCTRCFINWQKNSCCGSMVREIAFPLCIIHVTSQVIRGTRLYFISSPKRKFKNVCLTNAKIHGFHLKAKALYFNNTRPSSELRVTFHVP